MTQQEFTRARLVSMGLALWMIPSAVLGSIFFTPWKAAASPSPVFSLLYDASVFGPFICIVHYLRRYLDEIGFAGASGWVLRVMGAVGALVIILDAGLSFGLHRTTYDLMMHWQPPLLGLLFLALSLTFFRATLDLFAYRKKLGKLFFVTGAGYVTQLFVPAAGAPDQTPSLFGAALFAMGLLALVTETIAYVNISSLFSRAKQVAKQD